MAVLALQMLKDMGPAARQLTPEELDMPWLRLLSGAAQCEKGRRKGLVQPCEGLDVELPCNLAYSVLTAMSSVPSNNDDSIYEQLSNCLVRRVLFVTGAVDMAGLPPSDRGEAAFIGRSNVGKSSLVNMITNRKSLAYTSNTPGKTQQFNFFTVRLTSQHGQLHPFPGDKARPKMSISPRRDGVLDKDEIKAMMNDAFGYEPADLVVNEMIASVDAVDTELDGCTQLQ